MKAKTSGMEPKPRSVHNFRAEWLGLLCERYGGVERFAALVNKNPKHFSAIRSKKPNPKTMGGNVAREIEAAVLAADPKSTSWMRVGLLDTDPRSQARPAPSPAEDLSQVEAAVIALVTTLAKTLPTAAQDAMRFVEADDRHRIAGQFLFDVHAILARSAAPARAAPETARKPRSRHSSNHP